MGGSFAQSAHERGPRFHIGAENTLPKTKWRISRGDIWPSQSSIGVLSEQIFSGNINSLCGRVIL
ncbi:hypothetical protein BDQ12DRAFT_686981 [Crucibulum laeve]|uniref:Uncharacterized protein n=1 Tax=Crucibulum laeve TaxID=68775 RepID=A0A5C3LTE3_9AGAR|nr:hypothetical protein BDQ12DRAFT_686981 [Crucibulum laeve]